MNENPLFPGCFAACIVAGPTYVVAYLVASDVFGLVDTPDIAIGKLVFSPALFFLSVPFGALAALLPVIVGAQAMRSVSNHFVPARHPLVWTLVGASSGLVICALLDGIA